MRINMKFTSKGKAAIENFNNEELLEIFALPNLTQKACRRLYYLSNRKPSLRPFMQRNALGHLSEMDHEEYKALGTALENLCFIL